jgi:hypothetical protein
MLLLSLVSPASLVKADTVGAPKALTLDHCQSLGDGTIGNPNLDSVTCMILHVPNLPQGMRNTFVECDDEVSYYVDVSAGDRRLEKETFVLMSENTNTLLPSGYTIDFNAETAEFKGLGNCSK